MGESEWERLSVGERVWESVSECGREIECGRERE